ncbi:MAG: acyl-CoA dehydrogenase family protein, partial [Alphaproteobacteria bacterium]
MVDDTQRMLRDSVAAFVQRGEGPARLRRVRGTKPGYERDAWSRIAEAGWLGLHLPEDRGGFGLGATELAVVMEELGGGLAPEPVVPAAVLATGALAHAGGDAAALVPRIVSGETIPCAAWQEAEGDHAGTACATRAEGDRLTGQKQFLLSPDGSDGFVATAADAAGPCLWWVDA